MVTGKKYEKHIEGDVWEEQGKQWTIKNGLKRTVNSMDKQRKEQLIPLACPTCGKVMKNHYLDEKMWAIHKTCFDCVIDMEHAIMKSGKWADYQKHKVVANADAFIKDVESFMDDYADSSVSSGHVTEDGLVEKWKDADKKHIKQIKETTIRHLVDGLEKYKEQ